MTLFACETPSTGATAALAARIQSLLPELQTPRLKLRGPTLDDFPIYAEIACSSRGQFLGASSSREDAWYDFASMTAGWMLHGHGLLSVELRETRIVIGFVVLGFEPGDLEPELGFMLAEDAEGKGYANEAALAARAYAFDTLRLPSLVSYVDARNARSAALAQRLGAVRDGEIRSGNDDYTLIYRHPAPERQQ